jgi:nucleotide-binding universal stress UspA family protein
MTSENRGTPCEIGPPYSIIVAAIGEAEAAEVVTRAAVNAAKLSPACELHLVHVLDVPPVAEAALSGVGWSYPGAAKLRDRARQHLDHYTQLAGGALGRKVTAHLLVGTTTRAVVQVLDEVRADLAVIATHDGESALARALLGRVADGIVHKAPCSVLLVRASRGAGPAPGSER